MCSVDRKHETDIEKLLAAGHFSGPHDQFSADEARLIAERGEEHLARILREPAAPPDEKPNSGRRALAVVAIAAVLVVVVGSLRSNQASLPAAPPPQALSWSTREGSDTVADTRTRLENLAEAASGRAAGSMAGAQMLTQSWPGPVGSGSNSTTVTSISTKGEETSLVTKLAGHVRSDGTLSLPNLADARILQQQTIHALPANGLFSQQTMPRRALADQLIAGAPGCVSSRAECLVEGIARTDARELEAAPRMAAILRALAAEPGVTSLGFTTDRLGRKAEGFAALAARGDATVILVSPSGAYLGSETLRRDGGVSTVVGFSVVRDAR